MDAEDSPEEDGPLFGYLPPDDRLWRHPSELRSLAAAAPPAPARPAPRTWAVALTAGIVGAVVATGLGYVTGDLAPQRTTVLDQVTRVMTPNTLAAAVGTSAGWPQVVDAVSPSVVSIGRGGSAVVYADSQGATYLLTDERLVGGLRRVTATFSDGTTAQATVLRADAKTGLAILRAPGGHPAPDLGSLSTVREAQAAVAVGARPSGASGVVPGSISGLDRSVTDPDTSFTVCGLLAIAGVLPAGDDGGAVVDERGEVIGILTALQPSDPNDAGMSFAVPIDVAAHVATQVLQGRSVTHPWIGVDASGDLDSATARAMGVPGGAQVLGVDSGSPAALAGLGPSDVVLAVGGRIITSSGALTSAIEAATPGQPVSVEYRRGGQGATATATITVAEQPAYLDG